MPEPDIPDSVAMVPGLDGQKMSKSYGNTIDIFSPENVMKKRVMSIVTDATPVEAPKNPDTCNLFAIYSLFLDEAGRKALRARYLAPGLKYGEVKKELAEVIWNYFAPYRERRDALMQDPAGVHRIMKRGAEKARAVAATYLAAARHATGIDY